MVDVSTLPRFHERSFSLYRIDSNPGIDYLRHPSGVIVLQLGADHECLREGKEIVEVSYDTTGKKGGGGRDHTKQTVVGKGKKVRI